MSENFSLSHHTFFRKKRYHTIITSVFSHSNVFHLATNMVVLYFVGSDAILFLGAGRFLAFYLVSGCVSSLCFIAWPYVVPPSWSLGRVNSREPSLGASGAINAVTAFSICAFPNRTLLLYFVIPIPAAFLGIAYIFKDIFGLYSRNSLEGTGYAGQLGGAVTGITYYLLRRKRYR